MNKKTIIIGTFQTKDEATLRQVMEEAFKCGIYSFDTAPSYGTEIILGKNIAFLSKKYEVNREKILISDKIDDDQMYESKGDIRGYVEQALLKMNLEYIDTLFIHWPFEKYLDKTWECICRLKDDGLIRKTGLCNIRVRHLEGLHERTGSLPDVVQIERHPLRTCYDEINYCKMHGISVQAYSPLCRMDEKILKNKDILSLSERYSKSIAQIILRWHIDTGVVPVFMTTKAERVHQNCDIFSFSLDKEDIIKIDKLNQNYKIFLESYCCPGF